ncbi:MAG: hypothetical protein Q4D82_02695 [Neisseria sp.]|nr:hypothetical protein [Neisseria sp.]
MNRNENHIINHNTLLTPEQENSLKTYTTIIYALYAASLVTTGLTALVAVIMAYVKKPDAAGTFYRGHLEYLIKTFWGAFIGGIVGFVTAFIGIGFVIMLLTTVWFIYRVVAGFIKFHDKKPLSAEGWF